MAKSKVLIILSSGKEARQKFTAGLSLAYFSIKAALYEDLKVVFHGPSEELLLELNEEESEMFTYLLKNGHIDSACVAIAERAGIDKKLSSLGLKLMPSKDIIAKYINGGYEALVF